MPQEHPEVIALFKDFEAATPTERVQRWNHIKQEQHDYLASPGHKFSSHWGDLVWVLVPANDDPAEFDVVKAECAARMAQTSGLADRKGTMEFQEHTSNLEIELEELLADNYAHHYGDYVHVRLLGHPYRRS